MQSIREAASIDKRPDKIAVLQFGEGNFLRAFVDWMLDIANERLDLNLGVMVVQPIAQGLVDTLNAQDGLYTVLLRGKENGAVTRQTRAVGCVRGGLNPYADFDAFLAQARNPDLRFIVSNTTEAGIVYTGQDALEDRPPASFPGKLTRLLYERWQAGLPGVIILPVELIDNNGGELHDCVLKTVEQWKLPPAFKAWLEWENVFAGTLVDRIVTGYPREDARALCEELGYEDKLLVAAEPFALWVIEGPDSIANALPLDQAGLPVVFTDNVKPYKMRKVRVLNGAHTSMVLAAYLCGLDTVGECMADPLVRPYLLHILDREILPTLPKDLEETQAFANAVVERFENPFNRHLLMSIALNSVSKFRARVLPSIHAYVEQFGSLPKALSFSLAALLAFYRAGAREKDGAYTVADDAPVLEAFEATRGEVPAVAVPKLLANAALWGEDLCAVDGLCARVTKVLETIEQAGMRAALTECMREVLA